MDYGSTYCCGRITYMKIRSSVIFILFSFYVLFSDAPLAFAHGDGITFVSTTTEGYIVDVDYGNDTLEAEKIGKFGFNLFTDERREKEVPYTKVLVRVKLNLQGGGSRDVFVGFLPKGHIDYGGIWLAFPERGSYTLSVKYYSETENGLIDRTFATEEFQVDILRSINDEKFKFTLEFWLGLLSGLLLVTVILLPILRFRK